MTSNGRSLGWDHTYLSNAATYRTEECIRAEVFGFERGCSVLFGMLLGLLRQYSPGGH